MNYKIDRSNGEETQVDIVADAVEQERLRVLQALLKIAAPPSTGFASLASRVDSISGTWTSSNSDTEAVVNDIWGKLHDEFGLDCRIVLADMTGTILNGKRSVVAGRYLAEIKRNLGET
jgi:hypothetical protein